MKLPRYMVVFSRVLTPDSTTVLLHDPAFDGTFIAAVEHAADLARKLSWASGYVIDAQVLDADTGGLLHSHTCVKAVNQ